jgi:hypothetical protein
MFTIKHPDFRERFRRLGKYQVSIVNNIAKQSFDSSIKEKARSFSSQSFAPVH